MDQTEELIMGVQQCEKEERFLGDFFITVIGSINIFNKYFFWITPKIVYDLSETCDQIPFEISLSTNHFISLYQSMKINLLKSHSSNK